MYVCSASAGRAETLPPRWCTSILRPLIKHLASDAHEIAAMQQTCIGFVGLRCDYVSRESTGECHLTDLRVVRGLAGRYASSRASCGSRAARRRRADGTCTTLAAVKWRHHSSKDIAAVARRRCCRSPSSPRSLQGDDTFAVIKHGLGPVGGAKPGEGRGGVQLLLLCAGGRADADGAARGARRRGATTRPCGRRASRSGSRRRGLGRDGGAGGVAALLSEARAAGQCAGAGAGARCLRYRALGYLPALLSSTCFAAFRGLLDTATPLRISLFYNALNAVWIRYTNLRMRARRRRRRSPRPSRSRWAASCTSRSCRSASVGGNCFPRSGGGRRARHGEGARRWSRRYASTADRA